MSFRNKIYGASWLLSLCVLLFSLPALAKAPLYSQSYGNPTDPGLIFLHGGPGFNSVLFEASTAQALANQGFYVIVYDRQAEGRSPQRNAEISLQTATEELRTLYQTYGLRQAYLIGHSFGGTVGLHFAQAYPEQVRALIWVGSPLSYPDTFQTIHRHCKAFYTDQKNSEGLGYLQQLQAMDSGSLNYSGYSFAHALQCGLYAPKRINPQARELYQQAAAAERQLTYQNPQTAVQGFYHNDHYTQLDLTEQLTQTAKQLPVFGIYGTEDGLFDAETLQRLSSILGKSSFYTVPEASHNVFVDQSAEFVKILAKIKTEIER